MNAKEVVKFVSEQVVKAKDNGNIVVTIDSLEKLLAAVDENIDSQAPLEQANIEFQKQTNEFHFQTSSELFRSLINSGQAALKSGMLVGGGAAAALLAFASSAWRSLSADGMELLGEGVFLLSIGVVAVAVATGFNYLAQYFYYQAFHKAEGSWEGWGGNVFNALSILLVICAYFLYGWACWKAYLMLHQFEVVKAIPLP